MKGRLLCSSNERRFNELHLNTASQTNVCDDLNRIALGWSGFNHNQAPECPHKDLVIRYMNRAENFRRLHRKDVFLLWKIFDPVGIGPRLGPFFMKKLVAFRIIGKIPLKNFYTGFIFPEIF